MSSTYDFEYTDTFCGEPNYAWVRRGRVTMPELTRYGYDGGTNYTAANKRATRHLMRKVKAELGLSGVRGVTTDLGDTIEFRPYGRSTVLFITYSYEEAG